MKSAVMVLTLIKTGESIIVPDFCNSCHSPFFGLILYSFLSQSFTWHLIQPGSQKSRKRKQISKNEAEKEIITWTARDREIVKSGTITVDSPLYTFMSTISPLARPAVEMKTTTTESPTVSAASKQDMPGYGERFRIYKTLEGLGQEKV